MIGDELGTRNAELGTCARSAAARSALRIGRSCQGFSLLEVVIALGILSVGLVGAIRVFPVGLRASQRAAQVSRATLAVQRTLESLKLKAWDELVEGRSVTREAPFDITVSIDQPAVPGLEEPDRLRRVTITVGWVQEGRVRLLTTVTYLYHAA